MFRIIGTHTRFVTQKHGTVDLNDLTPEKGLALCADPKFSYLSITENAVSVLKKTKVSDLMNLAKALPFEDLHILKESTSSKSVLKLIETRRPPEDKI